MFIMSCCFITDNFRHDLADLIQAVIRCIFCQTVYSLSSGLSLPDLTRNGDRAKTSSSNEAYDSLSHKR